MSNRMEVPISVVIPVGPAQHHVQWLYEALESLWDQEGATPTEIVLVDDQNHLDHVYWRDCLRKLPSANVTYLPTPWLSGVAHSFNFGIARANNELVIMMGSDDKLHPDCLEMAWASWRKHQHPLGYYWFEVEYSTGETQALPCHAAMVTKSLWKQTGGFPPESAVGAPDSIFMNNMLIQKGAAGTPIRVEGPNPLYWWRVHPDQETKVQTARYSGAIAAVKDAYAAHWRKPEWTR